MKWGRGENCLKELFGPLTCQGVEHQGDDDGQREADHKAQDAQQEGVFHQRPELDIGEKAGEVVEAHPDSGIREDFVARHKVLKGDQHAVNGQIVEQEHHRDRRQQHNQKRIVFLKMLPLFAAR